MLQFILPIERVVVVGPFFINHHVALGETVCSLSDAAPRPLPAHYSLAVLRMCACESFVCSCPADFFSSAIETRITAPTLSQASASLPSLYPAPAVRFCQLQAHPALA